MFGAISKLFRKSEPEPVLTRHTSPRPLLRGAAPLPKDGTATKAALPRALPTQVNPADCLTVPYSAIIRLIPQELWGKLAPAGLAGCSYIVSRQSVLEQLPHGSVKVSFGELRRAAPAGSFVNTPAEDSRLIDLPLSEILAQLHPDSFARRPNQARVEVSDAVPDLFGNKGERLAPLRVMEKKEVSNTTSLTRQNVSTPAVPTPAPTPKATAPAAPAPAAPPPRTNNIPPFPTVTPAQPAVPPPANRPMPASPALKMPAVPPLPTPGTPPVPFQFPIPKRSTAGPAQVARPLPKPASPKTPLSPAQVQPTPFPASFATSSFFIGLDVVAENWPDGVRQELAQLKMPDAKVALPSVEICEGLKRGRIQYPWRTIRSWIQPTPVYATASPHDDLVLELPLRTLTPLFLDFIRANPINRQVADAENITEFFRKAEQASGTSPELLRPLFDTPPPVLPPAPPAFVPPPAAAAPPARPSMSAVAPAASLAAAAPVAAPPAPIAPATPAPTPAPAAAAEPTIENGLLCLPLPLIASGWPEPVLRDIAQFGLAGSRVGIPVAELEAGIRVGRIEFVWRELCAWLQPPSKPAQVSINGENRVILPLHLIAPLFLKNRVAAQSRRKTTVTDSIPDLFSASGKPLAPPAASPEPAPPAETAPKATAAPVAPAAPAGKPAEPAPTVPSAAPIPRAPAAPPAPAVPTAPAAAATPALPPKKAPTNLSELFGEQDKKTWTPNEIVQRTAQLPNVAGALIALQDGLLVASNMPPGLKTETIAAFVPQIFGRLNQYSKELQLGETKAVSFSVEAGTVQVYNAGIIYFAAFAKTGTLLPLAELQLIAGELNRHTK